MTIAILSDSHDHLDNLKTALAAIRQMNVKTILFCGDLCSPFMLEPFGDVDGIGVHLVFGNNDGDQFNMAQKALGAYPHITLHGQYAALELDHKRVGMTHYPFYATAMAKSAEYDLVAFGHDHEARALEFGGCLAVNPGALIARTPSFAVYDPFAHAATFHHLDGSILNIDTLY